MTGRLIGGRYEIVRKIAEGGMGAVYEAQHHLTKQTVALKILFPHIGRDEGARQRFMREVSAPAQIGHDGIVAVHDAGFDSQDGSLFVEWRESGGPPVAPPTRKGFGESVITRSLQYSPGGGAELHYEPEGLRCIIRIPAIDLT